MAIKKTVLGNVIGPQGPQGEPGPQGVQGEVGPQGEPGTPGIDGKDGKNGTTWTAGTAIGGLNSSPTVFPGSGIVASVGDRYINTDTGALYLCVSEGMSSKAQWVFDRFLIKDINIISDAWKRNILTNFVDVCTKIAYGNGMYITVGAGRCYSSTNFKTWESRYPLSNPKNTTYNTITFGNGMFFVGGIGTIGDENEEFVIQSSDGKNWKQIWSSTQLGGVDYILCTGSTLWVFSGVMVSRDFSNGYPQDQFPFASFSSEQRVISAASKNENEVVIVTDAGNAYYIDYSLPESNRVVQINGNVNSVAYNNGIFVFTTNDGRIERFSDHSTAWYPIQLSVGGGLSNIIFANGEFMAINKISGEYYKSNDCDNWTTYKGGIMSEAVTDVIFGDNKFVAVVDGLPDHYLNALQINKTLEEIIIELYTKLMSN